MIILTLYEDIHMDLNNINKDHDVQQKKQFYDNSFYISNAVDAFLSFYN